ncbi:sugar phosphate isomerase/epimerase [Candidatus Woesearchaeota archaeon]|nr:sugar phosphate isomerase/epimerase [Candidatus Woesearchaeota archaeon]
MPVKLKNRIATSNKLLSLYPIHEAVAIMARAGYEAIELWPEFLDQQVGKGLTSVEKVKAALKENDMVGVIHCPLRDLNDPARKYNISSKDKMFREKSLKMVLKAVELANELGLNIITVHPGHTDKEDETADDEYWRLQIDAFRQLTKRGEELGVFIGLEPMEKRPKEFIIEPEHVQKILHKIGSENLGITFDLIHAFTNGEDKPLEFLDWMEEDIIHVHVSGHSKDKVHVPFHMTDIPHAYLDNVFSHLIGKGYKGIISIEGHTKGLHEQTRDHQEGIVRKNIEYVRRELKALHL